MLNLIYFIKKDTWFNLDIFDAQNMSRKNNEMRHPFEASGQSLLFKKCFAA